jgi:hypothetical protein
MCNLIRDDQSANIFVPQWLGETILGKAPMVQRSLGRTRISGGKKTEEAFFCWPQGCQIFHGTRYQNQKNCTK